MIEDSGKDQLFISNLTEIILANLKNENFGVNELASESHISKYSLRRRLNALTSKTVNQFIRETRLRKALEMLCNEDVNVTEVTYKVGFGSPAYFNTCFHEFFGYPPGKVTKGSSNNTEEKNSVQTLVKQKGKRSVRRKHIILSIAIPLVAILVYLGYYIFLRNFAVYEVIHLKQPEKSIAVLPFKNLSDTLANQYFIDGLMEEILTDLCRMHELRVISRTSVEQFHGSGKSAREIGKKLDVDYIVEGSGQKYGNIFRLRVQLIEASRDRHIWANTYEQEILETKDIFKIQSQIAQDIATALKTGITSQEEDLIQQIPTNNSLAYDYYLMGKKYSYNFKWDSAIYMYGKSIEQDPEFALAYLERANKYSRIFFTKGDFNNGNWKGFDKLARADLETAFKINPDLPEIKFEQAQQAFRIYRNNDKALSLLNELEIQMTNNPSYYYLKGEVHRRMGHWEESIIEREKAILLDPLYAEYYNQIGNTYLIMRRYKEAMEFYNKPEMLGLDLILHHFKFETVLLWKGDLEEAQKSSGLSIPQLSKIMNLRFNYFYYSRQFEKLIPIATMTEDPIMYFPKTLNLAQLYFLNANISLSRKYADSAIAELSLKVKESPEDERYYAALGYACAFKGEKRKAIENGQKAIKLRPIKSDAWMGYFKEMDLAKIYTLTGEYDLALNMIERLLTIPGELSVPMLKIDPAYDKLRSLPRFQKILTTEYKTKF